jgi:hypothetical protein
VTFPVFVACWRLVVEETEKLLRVMVSATNSTAFNVASSNTTVPVERVIYYLGRELLNLKSLTQCKACLGLKVF